MVRVSLFKIIMHENKHDQIIILREKDGQRQLPIVIGMAEAAAIKMHVSNIKPPRPLTHDLLKTIIDESGFALDKVLIDKLEGNTFYAKLIFLHNERTINIDARPSDSIALALRVNAPIFVEEEVFEKLQFLNG